MTDQRTNLKKVTGINCSLYNLQLFWWPADQINCNSFWIKSFPQHNTKTKFLSHTAAFSLYFLMMLQSKPCRDGELLRQKSKPSWSQAHLTSPPIMLEYLVFNWCLTSKLSSHLLLTAELFIKTHLSLHMIQMLWRGEEYIKHAEEIGSLFKFHGSWWEIKGGQWQEK